MKTPDKERDETDHALRTERVQTDVTFADRQERIAQDADETVKQARARADEVLATARASADEKIGDPISRDAAERERRREDHVLRKERAAADTLLDDERAERARALAELLREEREDTDRYLDCERDQTDAVIASRDDFLGMVAHDLRGILGGMAMTAEALKKIPGDDSVRERIERLASRQQRFTARMARLVGDLVDVASIEAGKMHVARAENDAGRLMQEVADAWEPLATARTISFYTRIGPGPLRAVFDHGRIMQVLSNLVSNAIKFTPPGGSVSVAVEKTDGVVLFSVEDDGPGVAPEKVAACFDRYWQAAPTDGRGLGLGLYISKSIVEAHGGKIWVESKPQRRGSRFAFTVAEGQGTSRPK